MGHPPGTVGHLPGTIGQSVPSWLKLKLGEARKLKLDWLGLARKQIGNQSLAHLKLEKNMKIPSQARLGLNFFLCELALLGLRIYLLNFRAGLARARICFFSLSWIGLGS